MEDLKQVKIKAPKGYEIDKENSTFEVIKFKKTAPKDIMERVKTFEDACETKGVSPEDELPYANPKNKKQKALNAVAMLWLIAEVLCEGWEADYNNSNQYKYYPYFKKVGGSGFGFSNAGCGCDYTRTYIGSRLCFPNEKLAKYFGTQFIDLHNIVLLKQNGI